MSEYASTTLLPEGLAEARADFCAENINFFRDQMMVEQDGDGTLPRVEIDRMYVGRITDGEVQYDVEVMDAPDTHDILAPGEPSIFVPHEPIWAVHTQTHPTELHAEGGKVGLPEFRLVYVGIEGIPQEDHDLIRSEVQYDNTPGPDQIRPTATEQELDAIRLILDRSNFLYELGSLYGADMDALVDDLRGLFTSENDSPDFLALIEDTTVRIRRELDSIDNFMEVRWQPPEPVEAVSA